MLRRLAAADLPAFQAYRHDPEVGHYQGWTPMSDEAALAFLIEMNAAPLLQPGSWTQIAIADPATSQLLGDLGLFLAADSRHAEIGFTLAAQAQGRGIATAAVTEALKLIFENSAAERVIGITDARNAPSIRLLERVGMRRVETTNAIFRGEPCVEYVYALARGAVS